MRMFASDHRFGRVEEIQYLLMALANNTNGHHLLGARTWYQIVLQAELMAEWEGLAEVPSAFSNYVDQDLNMEDE